jgi:glycosylphosphatidylinositol transamidase (GPIT) subunit GPI8/ABC-type branched-subunit amino acid transport system substrate-binding protein
MRSRPCYRWGSSVLRSRPVPRLAGVSLSVGLCFASACTSNDAKPPAHIGIVIGAPGTTSATLRPLYDWAIATVNDAGGAGGRRLEAKYVELSGDVLDSMPAQEALAAQLVRDPDLVAVAGLFSFAMAPTFVAAKIPYITPETGDDDVFRAFHEGGYVWRTLESESTALWFFLAEAKGRGDKQQKAETTVGLLTSTDPYGETFFDWFGFHATELGLTALSPVQYDQNSESCERAVDELLSQGAPDFLIAVPSGKDPVAQATCMVRTLKARDAKSQVMLADSVHVPGLITALGADAEGLVGYNDAPDPGAGFAEAFTLKTGLAQPPEHAANVVDAITLLAYGLEKSAGLGRQALDKAMRAVVDGRGASVRWDEFKDGLARIRDGETPDLAGASGPLSFDREVYTDPTSSFFDRWIVEDGAFKTTHHVTTASEGSSNVFSQSAVTRGLKTLQADAVTGGGGTANLPPLQENWALIVATSASWPNYRHQADALAHYQALKANGFDDDHIVLITADDVADAADNARKGEIINRPDGPDVRSGALHDYRGKSLTPAQLMAVLEGSSDPALPAVLHSKAGDNIYVMIVGHGGVEGPYLGMDARAATDVDQNNFLSPTLFAGTVARMKHNAQFRRMFIAVDACHAGILAPAFETAGIPDVILFASAAAAESSFSANYSSQLKAWTADQFAFNLLKTVSSPAVSISAVYTRLYESVSGSHVQVANQRQFGDTSQILLSEFVTRQAR